jgi:ABC-type transport system substrate-binding protein
LLTEAGYPNGFEMDCVTNGPPENADVMTQQFLEQVGVRVNFVQQESVVARQTLTDKTFKHAHARLSQTGSTGYDPTKVLREWFLPDSPRNFGSINDPVMTSLIERATYAVDASEQQRLLREIHERDIDQCYRLDRYVAFANFVRQPWVQNAASAVQGYFTAYGYHQVTVVWIDNTGPEGRAGRLKT